MKSESDGYNYETPFENQFQQPVSGHFVSKCKLKSDSKYRVFR